MKDIFRFLGLGAGLAIAAWAVACSSGSGNANESDAGNTAGTGGSTGTGTETGGSTNGGGSSAGGSTSTNNCKPTVLYDFSNQTLQGFIFSNVVGTAPYVNLVAPGDAGVSSNTPQLQWASKDFDGASATPGSMMIQATYTNWNQSVSVEVNGPSDANNNPIDLTGKTLHAKVQLVKGLSPNPSAPGGVVFYIKTGSAYDWGQAPWTNLNSPGTWIDVAFDTSAPASGSSANFNPKLPIQMGFQISSGGGGTVGAFGSVPQDTVVYIDQITMVPSSCI